MKGFDRVTYWANTHTIKRITERFTGTPRKHAKGIAEAMAYEADLLIEFGPFRYLKYGNFFLPCVRKSKTKKFYTITSFLTWNMIEQGDGNGLQIEVNKYAEEALNY